MKEKIRKLFKKRILRHTVNILLLFIVWLVLTVWYIVIFDQSILVISYNYGKDTFTHFNTNKLLKGQSISGNFTAADDNLGIVSLRFKNFQRVPYTDEDMLLFQLKEKGTHEWYYENNYRSGFIYDLPFMPFGFPVIHNSKGKTYEFKLTSLKGNEKNGVALSDRNPVIATKYQADKATLLHNPQEFFVFAVKKFVNSFQTIDISFSSFIFSLPFLFYIVWSSRLKKYLPKYTLAIFLLAIILIDILFLQILNDLLYLTIPIIWISLMIVYELDSSYSFKVGLFFLLFAPVFLQLNNVGVAVQASSFAFVFFFTAVLHALFEEYRLKKTSK